MTATIPDSHRDLLAKPGVASLSTIGPSGRPQVTAIWYLLDGEVVRTSLTKMRQKYANLVATPKATLFVIDPSNPFRTLELRADVTIEDDPDLAFMGRLVGHYGTDLDNIQAPKNDRVVVTLTPARVVTNG